MAVQHTRSPLIRRARNKKEKASAHDPGPGIYKRFDSSGKLRQPHPCEVSLPSIRFDQDGKERKQNFKLCNIETAGGKCFSESAAGPIGMLGEFVHSQLSAKGVIDYRSKNRALHRLNDWLKLGRPEDLRACPKPIQTAVLDWIRCLPSLQLGRNVADDAWSRAAVDSLMADFPRPLRPVPSKIQALVDQSARLLEHPDPAQDDSEGSEVSHMPFDTTESAALQEDAARSAVNSTPTQSSASHTSVPRTTAAISSWDRTPSSSQQNIHRDALCMASAPSTSTDQMSWVPCCASSITNGDSTSTSAAEHLEAGLILARRLSAERDPCPQHHLLPDRAIPWQPDHTWLGCTFL